MSTDATPLICHLRIGRSTGLGMMGFWQNQEAKRLAGLLYISRASSSQRSMGMVTAPNSKWKRSNRLEDDTAREALINLKPLNLLRFMWISGVKCHSAFFVFRQGIVLTPNRVPGPSAAPGFSRMYSRKRARRLSAFRVVG